MKLERNRPRGAVARYALATGFTVAALLVRWLAEPVLHGDLTRLAQVLSNLLHNAARYTPQEGASACRSKSATARPC